MQVLITHSSLLRSRALSFSRWQLLGAGLVLMLLFLLASGTIYHFIFLKAAREGWPIVSQIVRLVVRDEIAQRDRFMRENLDAIAQKVGEVQAKLVKLEAMGDRVVGLVGVKAEELKPLKRPAQGGGAAAASGAGGPYVPLDHPTLEELQGVVERLDVAADTNTDIFTLMESRLLESRLQALLVPSSAPVNVAVGSGFGVRLDPFTGRGSLHTGLDFPAEVGTPVYAAAGGIVLASEWYAAYGNVLEIDHGNGLVTRYAHCASFAVERGALVKRGQLIARVGSTGRSTGPHLHFEVLVDGAPQDPARFLAAGNNAAGKEFARRPLAASNPQAAPGAATAQAAAGVQGTVVRLPVPASPQPTSGLPPAPGAQPAFGSQNPPAMSSPAAPPASPTLPAAIASPQPAASR